MTKGFYTAEYLPYEGTLLQEWPTKKEAVDHYKEAIEEVDKEELIGTALLYIEVVKEKGKWK